MNTTKEKNISPRFSQTIEEALVTFLRQHHSHLPKNLHALAIHAIEKPLLKLIMEKAEDNQSQAAKILGLNRATLKKKLTEYKLI